MMTYSGLRFADVQKLRSLATNDGSIRGAILTSKTKRQQGQDWPWACPRMGITSTTNWVRPLLDTSAA